MGRAKKYTLYQLKKLLMSTVQPPKWFKAIVVLALVWNLMGIFNFYMQISLSDDAIAAFPVAEQELMNSTPLWSLVAFAIGVFGGTLGCIGLVVQKRWAFYPLLFSLIAVMAQMGYWLFFTKAVEVYGDSTYAMPLVVILVAFLLFRLSKNGIDKGYLN